MATGLHEQFARDYRGEAASDRRFGLIVGALLVLFAAIRTTYLDGELGVLAIALGAPGLALVAAALVRPATLAPLNRAWGWLGLVLHKVTNPLFLGIIYAGAIVPTGVLMRAFGKDPMGLRRKPDGTYWIARRTTASTAQSLEKPF